MPTLNQKCVSHWRLDALIYKYSQRDIRHYRSFILCNSQALTSLSTQATAFGPMVMGLGKSPAFIFKYMVGFDMHTLARAGAHFVELLTKE